MNMSVEQQLESLSGVLVALQEAVAHQSRDDLKEHGNRNLVIAIQSVKRLIENKKQDVIHSEVQEYVDTCVGSLGLHNMD